MNCLFANAAYGCIPEEKIHRQIEELVEEVMDGVLPGEDMEWDNALEKVSKMERGRKIITDMGFPASANLLGVHQTTDGNKLEEGTIVVGWGLLAFPGVCYTEEFRRAVQSSLNLDWHLWVSDG